MAETNMQISRILSLITHRLRFGAAWSAMLLLCATLAAAPAERPNVVLVMTDDQGYGDLGIHGNKHIRTPNIDRFARDGVQLTRFYVSPVCAPTRASLLTGRYHYRTGVIHTSRGGAKMHGEEATVAELLHAAGYRTGIFGKWHVGDNYPMRPSDQGFDESLIHKSGAINMQSDQPSSYFNPRLWHNDAPRHTSGYCTDVFFDAALEFMGRNRERPFFIYLPTNAPHTPLEVSPKYSDPYRAMGLDDTTARAYGMIENIDENFGRLIAALDRLGLRSNTLVVFLTDNGAQHARYNAGLRMRKGSAYEGGIRAPSFFQWPAKWKGGRSIDRIAAHIDLLPTILDACRVPLPDASAVDGTSLLPLLGGSIAPDRWPERTLFIQCHRGLQPKLYQNAAILTQRVKLVGYPGTFGNEELDTGSQPPVFELYDLTTDSSEEKNLASARPDVVRALRAAYERWFEDVRASRGFKPGVIHIGSEREDPIRLSRYQDGDFRGNVAHGWPVKVLQDGQYNVTFFRGDHRGDARLVVRWAGKTVRKELTPWEDTADFQLTAEEGILDIFLESPDGRRLPHEGNDVDGDAVLRRL